MKSIRAFVVLTVLANGPMAWALDPYSPGNLSDVSSTSVESLIKTVSVGTAHRAYRPASALPIAIGLDVAVETTLVSLSSDFKNALSLATDRPASELPSLIPVPKLSVHKGLGFGVEAGLSWIGYKGFLQILGLEGKWTFFGGAAAGPAVATRVSYTRSKLWFIESEVLALDVLGSLDLVLIEPYFGTGLQIWSGGLKDLPSGGNALPAGVSAEQSGVTPHFFAGLPVRLGFFRLTAEAGYSFSGTTVFGGKLALAF